MLSLTILIIFFDISDFIRYGIISAILLVFCVFYVFSVISFSFLYYFIVCYYFKFRFKSFNNSILLNSSSQLFLRFKFIDKLIKDHNKICYDIKVYNKFWQKYYLVICYSLIPFNLLLLHGIIFEKMLFFAFMCNN